MHPFHVETVPFRRHLARRDRSAYLTRPGMRYVDVAGHAIRIRGAGDGPRAVVFAADSPVVIEHHDRLIDLLAPHVAVYCLDMPGFGFSAPPRDFPFTPDAFVDPLEALLEALGHDSYALAFPCFTAYVAMRLAARRPDLVDGLVLSQAPSWQAELDWFASFWLSGKGLLMTPGLGQAVLSAWHLTAPAGWLHPWFRLTVPRPAADRRALRATTLEATRAGMINCWASIYQAWHRCPQPHFGGAELPSLAVWGPDDRTHRACAEGSIREHLPLAHCERYAGCGHYPYLQRPEAFAQRLLAFMGA